ncbi:MAG: hypothetical protein ABW068_15770 [Candidatus Thiodiazotropha sp.]
MHHSPTLFNVYIGIDYSGAKTPDDGLPGLWVYRAGLEHSPREVLPPAGRSRYWTRRGLAQWLELQLNETLPTLVGIDHSFSFPGCYFERYDIKNWPDFLEDFHDHWPTDEEGVSVERVRQGQHGMGNVRSGNARWRRIAEQRAGAKSVFHFDVPGSVAKSTHAGLPWLRHLRLRLGNQVHFWPYDGWLAPAGCSLIAEAYPALYSHDVPRDGRTQDQQDAYAIAAWLRQTDRVGSLRDYLAPTLTRHERTVAVTEGWILGVR